MTYRGLRLVGSTAKLVSSEQVSGVGCVIGGASQEI